MSDMVTLTLAHPLTGVQAERLHIDGADKTKNYTQGQQVKLPRDDARLVINAGYAKDVEPQDNEAVAKVLSSGTKSSKTAKS